MKYLLVLLLLIATPVAGHGWLPPLTSRLMLDTSFDVRARQGNDHVLVEVTKWSDRVRVSLTIARPEPPSEPGDSCDRTLLDGSGRALVPPADVVIARDLRWAAIHTVIPVIDNLSRQAVPVRLDLTMRARGGFHRSDGSGDPGYFDAAATVVVASACEAFVGPNQVSVRGMITRSALE